MIASYLMPLYLEMSSKTFFYEFHVFNHSREVSKPLCNTGIPTLRLLPLRLKFSIYHTTMFEPSYRVSDFLKTRVAKSTEIPGAK